MTVIWSDYPRKKEVDAKMPKAISIAPPLNTIDISKGGITVTIKDFRLASNVWTSIGTQKQALGLTVEYEGKEYSQLFSLDREVLSGSIGRILVSIGIEDTSTDDFGEKLKALIGKQFRVVQKGGKIYWYP